jgi:hypothetical protein
VSVPHNVDAEASLVGSLIGCPAAIPAALAVVQPEDLYTPRYGRILGVLADMHQRGEGINPTTIAAHLPVLNGSAKREVLGLEAGCPSLAASLDYARIVADQAYRRRLMAAAHELNRAARSGDDLEDAVAHLEEAAGRRPAVAGSPWGQEENLGAVLATTDADDAPKTLVRTDGVPLVYPGKNHSFHGETETGKSWAGVVVCAERMAAGEHVLYMDFEDSARSVVARLVALGVAPGLLRERFHYQRLDEPMGRAGAAAHDELLARLGPSVVVIDGVTEALVLHGWSFKDNDDIARFISGVPRRINRHGAATIMIDHVGRDRETRGRFAIGAQHKLAGLDGAAYTFEVAEPFGRGRHGIARITVAKDRPGHVRRYADRYGRIAELHLVADDEGSVTTAELRPPGENATGAEFRPTGLMEKVSRYLERHLDPLSQKLIEEGVVGNRVFVRKALHLLVEDGYVTVEAGPRNARLHRSARPYREDTPSDD